MLWNLAARSPRQFVADLGAGLTSSRSLRSGLVRAVVGALFAFLSLVLVATTLAFATSDIFSTFATIVFLAGLALDALIGDAIRTAIGIER